LPAVREDPNKLEESAMSGRHQQTWWTASVCLLAGGAAVGLWAWGDPALKQPEGAAIQAPEVKVAPAPAPEVKAAPFVMEGCGEPSAPSPKVAGNPEARRGAQRGLDFLAAEAVAWQERHQCYGCHVQAVTVEALSVGYRNQYQVKEANLQEVLRGMLDVTGGAHKPGGLGHSSPSIAGAAKIMGGAAFARYDQLVDGKLQQELLTEARGVLAFQKPDGSVTAEWVNPPVGTGTLQYTAEAIITWKQAYDRSADDQWLAAIQRAEDFLQGQVAGWPEGGPASIQEINYVTMGLVAAGVGSNEDVMQRLGGMLRRRQHQDGGWALQGAPSDGTQGAQGASEPFATGQTLYALRLLGYTEADQEIARGTQWLLARQAEDGGWSHGGFGKAEAMWAVLGLVSVDVLTVSVEGLRDGQRVEGEVALQVEARDNAGGGVVKVEALVDDLLVYGACGPKMAWRWDTRGLSKGKHIVDLRATNARGEVSLRRFEVYAGDVFLTQLGSRFTAEGTELSLRNIGPQDQRAQLQVEIFAAVDKGGVEEAGARVRTLRLAGQQGAQRFVWDGKDEAGVAATGERYIARLRWVDEAGVERQQESLNFVHASAEDQERKYAQIQGALELPNEAAAANVELELVNGAGVVVQRTRSTAGGNYLFRNLKDDQQYKVRVKKEGFVAAESAPIAPAPAAKARADMKLMAE
jgi:hypothetical protein